MYSSEILHHIENYSTPTEMTVKYVGRNLLFRIKYELIPYEISKAH